MSLAWEFFCVCSWFKCKYNTKLFLRNSFTFFFFQVAKWFATIFVTEWYLYLSTSFPYSKHVVPTSLNLLLLFLWIFFFFLSPSPFFHLFPLLPLFLNICLKLSQFFFEFVPKKVYFITVFSRYVIIIPFRFHPRTYAV